MRASFARIHRAIDCAAWLEAQINEALAGIRLYGFPVVTRQRRRVSTRIRHLASGFVIALARQHNRRATGIPARILSILKLTCVNDGATGSWFTRGFAVD